MDARWNQETEKNPLAPSHISTRIDVHLPYNVDAFQYSPPVPPIPESSDLGPSLLLPSITVLKGVSREEQLSNHGVYMRLSCAAKFVLAGTAQVA